jgi:hypothetical protein
MPTLQEIIAELRSNATVSVPFTGMALGKLGKNASYDAAKKGTLGVKVFNAGGKLRVASVEVLQRLGLAEQPEDAGQASAAASVAPAKKAPRPKLQARSSAAVQAQGKRAAMELEAAMALLTKIATGELVLTEPRNRTREMSD